jgi:hypothetical protein
MGYTLQVVEEDISGQFLAQTAKLPAIYASVLGLGGAFIRTHHRYTNRTGNLERSSQGVVTRYSRDSIEAELQMNMVYASYVRGRGLTSFDEGVNLVKAELDEQLGAWANEMSEIVGFAVSVDRSGD